MHQHLSLSLVCSLVIFAHLITFSDFVSNTRLFRAKGIAIVFVDAAAVIVVIVIVYDVI